MRLSFDEEVPLETIENLRKTLTKSRWPPSVYNTFAFNYKAPPVLQRTLSQRQQSIKKTHRSLTNVVNLTKRTSSVSIGKRVSKTAIADDNTARKYKAIKKDSMESLSEDDSATTMKQVMFEQENRGADKLQQSPICKDYDRLGLGGITKISTTSAWRLSMANFHYSVCKSYPSVLVVPHRISDDTLLKVAKNHRLSRFPVAVWRHKRTKGTLLRSGALNKSVLQAILRTSLGSNQTQGNLSSNVTEDEKLYSEIGNKCYTIFYVFSLFFSFDEF